MAGIHVILVHGTFAPNAPWTRDRSRFRQALAAGLGPEGAAATFHECGWSGRNRLTDRLQAARQLAAAIETIQAEEAAARIFLVGHSHGGSVIALLLKERRDLAVRIAGSAFLSTPFYSLRVDPNFQRFFTLAAANLLFLVVPLFVAIICGLILASDLFRVLADILGGGVVDAALIAAPLLAMLVGPLLFLLVWRGGWFRASRLGALRGRRRRFAALETARMPPGNYIFLRASGDEAALSLSLVLFLNAWLRKLSSYVSLCAILFERYVLGRGGWRRKAATLTLLALLYLLLLPLHLFPGPNGFGLFNFDWEQGVFAIVGNVLFVGQVAASYLVFGEAHTVGFRAAGVVLWLCDLLLLSNVFGFLLVFTGYLLGAAGLWASGWLSLAQALYMEVSVEPVPLGNHRIVHIDWRESAGSGGLNHSVVYEDAQAISAIAAWMTAESNSARSRTAVTAARHVT